MTTGPQPDDFTVTGDAPLAEFRQGLTGTRALTLLNEAGGRLIVQLPVGVGKTTWLVAIITEALVYKLFDLVLVLVPRWDVLQELCERLPADAQPLILRPRPRRRCGDLDEQWQQFERQGCAALGRQKLCGICPRAKNCYWPGQYGKRLRAARLILTTQMHIEMNPEFINSIRQKVRATNVLVLIDESNVLLRRVERSISAADLCRFNEVLEDIEGENASVKNRGQQWLNLIRTVAGASTIDLRDGNWRFPWVGSTWAAKVQERGWDRFGQQFRFIGYDLRHFSRSDVSSRERLANGDIRFASPTQLGAKFIVFTGSMSAALARFRLDPDHRNPKLVSPFEHYRFVHPSTRWFNLNNMSGSARYFQRNAPRLMDFFAALIARNIAVGKLTLLVSRKKFLGLCRDLLRERLSRLVDGPFRIITRDWAKHDLNSANCIPLISYGVVGINRFEHFDAAYCLNCYFVPPSAIEQTVQELEASTERYGVSIQMIGRPARRSARVALPDARETISPWLANQVLVQKEADVIVQAVGRVRPFTRSREVITFHGGLLPTVKYNLEFLNLGQARAYFGIETPTRSARHSRADRVALLKAEGRTNLQIAEELGVSLSSVKRDGRKRRVIQPLNNFS